MMQVSLIPWLQALQSSALPRHRKSCSQPPKGHMYFKHVWGGEGLIWFSKVEKLKYKKLVVMQPRFKNKSKLPAREQNIPDQSTRSNTVYHLLVKNSKKEWSGGVLTFCHWKGGLLEREAYLREGV